jgi:hypothetical protein
MEGSLLSNDGRGWDHLNFSVFTFHAAPACARLRQPQARRMTHIRENSQHQTSENVEVSTGEITWQTRQK